MSKIAIVFPGQGSQKLGMLEDYYQQFESIRQTFEQANDALGFNLWEIIQQDEQKLNQTEYTQPALLAASVAIWKVIQQTKDIKPYAFAGHSLGEYSALVCAGSMAFGDALSLVQKRGQLMQTAVTDTPCAMSAIMGLSNEEVISCCVAASKVGVVEPANFNSHGQVVISGEKAAVKKANEIAKEKGVKRAQILPVSVPSHCSLMKPAAEAFALSLKNIAIQTPQTQVIHNYDVVSHQDAEHIREVLIKQLYSPVRWTQTIEKLADLGVETVIECGANKVLTGLNKRIVKSLNYVDTATVSNLDKLIELQTN